MKIQFFLIAAFSLFLYQIINADEASSRMPKVFADPFSGFIYGKTVTQNPNHEGSEGETRVYTVGFDKDSLVDTYSFYIWNPYIIMHEGGYTLIRSGEWPRIGTDPVIIGFYSNGETVKEYFLKDFLKLGATENRSIGHYNLFTKYPELVHVGGNRYEFRATLNNGKEIKFNLKTGRII